jgi:hypothetical protein
LTLTLGAGAGEALAGTLTLLDLLPNGCIALLRLATAGTELADRGLEVTDLLVSSAMGAPECAGLVLERFGD